MPTLVAHIFGIGSARAETPAPAPYGVVRDDALTPAAEAAMAEAAKASLASRTEATAITASPLSMDLVSGPAGPSTDPRATGSSSMSSPPDKAEAAPSRMRQLETLPPVRLLPPIEMRLATPFGTAGTVLEELPLPADDLWTRIRARFRLPNLDTPEVAKWEQWYASRPDYMARLIDRSRRFLYYVVVEVEKRDMPSEIALLPMIESAYNPNALSTSRASGIWQFIPSTANVYGLKQNFWFDSRRDVIAATASALTYLEKLNGQFEDWQLALASYNWGEGNVSRAIERNRRAGRGVDYLSLPMPDETRNYLPKLQAVKNIVADPKRFGLELGDIPDAPYFTVVTTDKKMDVRRAAELAEMPVDEFLYLNPHHNRPVIAGADQHTLLLPIDKAEVFAAKLELIDQPLVSWQAYRMRAGETLAQVAAKFGMSVATLRAVNGIGARMTVPAGHAVLVPAQRNSDESADSLNHAVFTAVPQGRTFYHRVARGETLVGLASRYGVGVDDLRRWNGLDKHPIKVGQQLRITSDHGGVATAARPAAKKAAAAHPPHPPRAQASKARAPNKMAKTSAGTKKGRTASATAAGKPSKTEANSSAGARTTLRPG